METRSITEIKIYLLVLNPMRGNTESAVLLAIAYEKEKLIAWYNSLKVEPYVETGEPSFPVHGSSHQWHKTFKQGSELEWYNPCYDNFELDHHGHGIHERWFTQEEIDKSGTKFIH